jgi:tetratricopeptide (TPR) repeat protein
MQIKKNVLLITSFVIAIIAITLIYAAAKNSFGKDIIPDIATSTQQKVNSNFLQGMALYNENKIKEAEPILQKEADENNIHAFGPLGHIKLMLGNDLGAEKYLILALNSKDDPLIDKGYIPSTMCNLGSVYFNLQNFEKAKFYWQSAAAMGFSVATKKLKMLEEK